MVEKQGLTKLLESINAGYYSQVGGWSGGELPCSIIAEALINAGYTSPAAQPPQDKSVALDETVQCFKCGEYIDLPQRNLNEDDVDDVIYEIVKPDHKLAIKIRKAICAKFTQPVH